MKHPVWPTIIFNAMSMARERLSCQCQGLQDIIAVSPSVGLTKSAPVLSNNKIGVQYMIWVIIKRRYRKTPKRFVRNYDYVPLTS